MRELGTFGLFSADFPNDQVEDDQGNITVPSGRNVAEAICARLREAGMAPTAPRQHRFYGWAFELPIDGLRLWALLQYVEPWLLITEVRGGLFTSGGRRRRAHERGLDALDAALRGDPRFANLRWMTKAQFERG